MANLFNMVLQFFLYANHPKLTKITKLKFLYELGEFLGREDVLLTFQISKEDEDVKSFIKTLIKINEDHEHIKIKVILDKISGSSNMELKIINNEELNITINESNINIEKGDKSFILSSLKIVNENNLNINNTNDKISNNNSNPYDEYALLCLYQSCLNNAENNKLNKIIKWRKKILEISKSNGYIIGKTLANKTLNKFEITEFDIIDVFIL